MQITFQSANGVGGPPRGMGGIGSAEDSKGSANEGFSLCLRYQYRSVHISFSARNDTLNFLQMSGGGGCNPPAGPVYIDQRG
ncbi:hypothetical protein GTPT_2487 [Tatumella ptyseos ATCC 33301]|uniref:Uncharacterized protein n=1 Tax=Tatumella ptyseos ATCC 33301 TaxID=1005995 RepID=A0A085JCV1_9GAMM|nr:hypothetical protein GTPT_2487 [Tatumella ptyseos ATCC 33301]